MRTLNRAYVVWTWASASSQILVCACGASERGSLSPGAAASTVAEVSSTSAPLADGTSATISVFDGTSVPSSSSTPAVSGVPVFDSDAPFPASEFIGSQVFAAVVGGVKVAVYVGRGGTGVAAGEDNPVGMIKLVPFDRSIPYSGPSEILLPDCVGAARVGTPMVASIANVSVVCDVNRSTFSVDLTRGTVAPGVG